MVKLALGIILLSLTSCNGRPESNWLTTPQFTYNGIWDVYHDPNLSGTELVWINQSVALHVALSEGVFSFPYFGARAPRWHKVGGGFVKPKIYFYNKKVQYLNSPIKIGVKAYADFQKEEVHAVVGHKFSCPGLARAVHQLRCGPDPWEQDTNFSWPILISNQDILVDTLEKYR